MSKAKKIAKKSLGSTGVGGLLGMGSGGFISKVLGMAEKKKQQKQSDGLVELQADAEATARGVERKMARRLSRAGRAGTVLSEGGNLG